MIICLKQILLRRIHPYFFIIYLKLMEFWEIRIFHNIFFVSMSRKSKSVQPLIALSPKISNRAYLQGLQGELEASRVAVENITRLSTGQQKFNNKVGEIQQQLQTCISSITIQSKKQKILLELIGLLKGQMFKYQITKKKEEEAENAQREKLICKIQYEIDQLLQKHNEEIAKIHQLKDVANSRRSERVVYSSLFKKLEKQIKYYEELYKEAIIRTETTKNKQYHCLPQNSSFTPELRSNPITSLMSKESSQDIFNFEKKSIKRASEKKAVVINQPHEAQIANSVRQDWTVFMTTQKQDNDRQQKRKFLEINQQQYGQSRLSFRNTVHREQRILHIKEIMQKISYFTNLIDSVKSFVDFCSSVPTELVLQHYTDLQLKNQILLQQINETDEEICIKQLQNKALKNKLGQLEFSKKYSLSKNSHPQNTPPSQESIQQEEQKQIKQMLKQLIQVSDILGLKSQRCKQLAELTNYDKNSMLSQSQIQHLDFKISKLLSVVQPLDAKKVRLRQQTSNSEPAIQNLLEKMQKFGNCQKILDKNLFQQEYYKELSRRKVKLNKK